MKRIQLTITLIFLLLSPIINAQVLTKLDKDYSKTDFFFDSLYAIKFQEYIAEKNKIEEDGLYQRIDQAIQQAETVKQLEITNSTIKKLPKGFEKLTSLETLVFRNCKNLDLNSTFKQLEKLTNLKNLEISYSSKYQIPEGLAALSKLESLNLKGNKFVLLPNDFNAFTTLKTIDVSQNAVLNETFFFETLAKMPNLKNVNAAYCQIRTLPSLIYTIEELNIEGNLITTLPIEALQIPIINLSSNPFLDLNALFTTAQMGNQVKELYLNYCKIKEIPITIAALKGLEILHLKGNNLYTLPKEISTLKKLKVLDLSNEDNYVRTNRIESLPSTIGQLSQLETLNLRANNLTSLPKEFAQLQNLKTLNLSLNLLRTFPSSLYSLEKLQVLDLSFTEINRIPDEIENLTQLEYLNLTGNFFINYKLKINTLPETFGQLKLLKTLILKDNVIAILPNSFQNLTQLEYLDIKGNLLESLPENFGQIAQLKELDLKGNEIKMLPTSFSSLKKLEVLNLAFNFNIDTTSTEKTLLTMPQLKLVDISDCYFDKATVEKLRDKMPNTNFKVLNLVKK